MATAVRARANSTELGAADGGAHVAREALLKKLQSERGVYPSTWLALFDLDVASGRAQHELLLVLEKAIVSVPAPTKEAVEERPTLVAEYNVLWVKFSTAIRREPLENARKTFEKIASHENIRTNAYFYSAWSFVESSFNQREQARRVLLLGIERRASPSKQLELALQRLSPVDGASIVIPGFSLSSTPHDVETAAAVAAIQQTSVAKRPQVFDKENATHVNASKPAPAATQTIAIKDKRLSKPAQAKENSENGAIVHHNVQTPSQNAGNQAALASQGQASASRENPGGAPQRKSGDRPRTVLGDLTDTAHARPAPAAAAAAKEKEKKEKEEKDKAKERAQAENHPAPIPMAMPTAFPTPSSAAPTPSSVSATMSQQNANDLTATGRNDKRRRDFTRLAPLRRVIGGGAQRVLTQESPPKSHGLPTGDETEPLSPYKGEGDAEGNFDNATEVSPDPMPHISAPQLTERTSANKDSDTKLSATRTRDQRSLSVPASSSPFKPNQDLLQRMDQLLSEAATDALPPPSIVAPSLIPKPSTTVTHVAPSTATSLLQATGSDFNDSVLVRSPAPVKTEGRPHSKSAPSEVSPEVRVIAAAAQPNPVASRSIISPPTPNALPSSHLKAPVATPLLGEAPTSSAVKVSHSKLEAPKSHHGGEELPFTDYIKISDWDKHCLLVNGRPYIKLERVGRGGSSKVYKVLSQDGNIYAIKRVELAECDANTKQSYLEEIKLLEKLRNYDCIIKMVDSELNSRDNSLNIVLEFAEIDLAKMLARHPGGLYKTAENYMRLYWQQMCEAVAVVHEQERIVHGDIKPHNFVSVKGYLKLIDFGIAKTLEADTTHIGRDNLVGTLNYLAPETLKFSSQRQSKYGRPSDIWALGCILYQMVYGRPPFHGLHTFQTISALSDPNLKITLPLFDGEPLPTDLANVLAGCLNKDPAKRPTIRQLLAHPFLHPFVAQRKGLKPPASAPTSSAGAKQ